MEEFFRTIFGAGEGYAVISLRDADNAYTQDTWFTYPTEIDQMVAFAESHRLEDVTYSPVLFSERKRLKAYAKTVSVAYADSDTCPPEAYRVRPSITVRTAEGRTHNYWLLDDDYSPHEVALINRRMHHAHKADGTDSSFGHAAKLLRVPGTYNTTRDSDVAIVANSGAVYSMDELSAMYPNDGTPDKVYGTLRPLPATLPDRATTLNKLTDDAFISRLIFDEPPEGKRSEMRYKLESMLFRSGFDAEEVLVLVWDSPTCKFKQDGRPIQHLWEEILNAEVDPKNLPTVALNSQPSEDGAPLVTLKTKLTRVDYLTATERAGLGITFIDRYEQWAKGKTTSHPKYHRMAALMIMSVVYSEYGHIPFSFEKMRLNLWMMPLGNTTVDRKTTALNYLIDFIAGLEGHAQGIDYEYDAGSDATQQGLNKYLANKPHQSSLLHVDEVQEVLREVFSQGYLTGLVGYWTQLYSGRSRGMLRSTGDKQQIKAVPVNFMTYFMGITSHTAEALTLRNFESGFLTRFIYCIVEPRPYDPEADPLMMDSGVSHADPVRDALLNHVQVNRNYWSMRTTRDNTAPIDFDKDALDRLNKFGTAMKKNAMLTPSAAVLIAPVERLIASVAKTAALFAMDERKHNVALEHVLQAIALAEEWYNDLIKFSTMVSESAWEREVSSLLHFIISKGGKSSYGAAYNQFRDKLPQEFKMMVDSLDQRGIIRMSSQAGRAVLEVMNTDEQSGDS